MTPGFIHSIPIMANLLSIVTKHLRAERRAAPKPARIPSGDRPTYSSGEGPHL
jgi:hypothetical protein